MDNNNARFLAAENSALWYDTFMELSDSQKYDVFEARDDSYAGRFFMAVKTTGIFCRPGCPARTPKRQNCEFYPDAETAVSAGYRACKRCHPLGLPGEESSLIRKLINLVETDPERRWSEQDLQARGVDPSTARRNFKARFGMTFSAYVRQRRLALARTNLDAGESVIQAQLAAGFESASGFRAAYSKTFGSPPNQAGLAPLMAEWLDTPLGPMIVICSEEAVYLAEFTVRKNLTGQFEKLLKVYDRPILPGRTKVTDQAEDQLKAYFKGRLQEFDLPLRPTGTEFQRRVWDALCDIPFGQTRSYGELAVAIGNEKAFRAVASSNARNGLAIIIPCHRVINTGGKLGGYAGGLAKKQWLLDHEVKFA